MSRQLAALLVITVALSLFIAYAQVTTSVTVIDETGAKVSGAVVTAYQGGAKVGECTTDATGTCSLTINNATTTFAVAYSTAKYGIQTFSAIKSTMTIDLRTLNYVKVGTNVTYSIPFTVKVKLTNTPVDLKTNCTIYAKESLDFTFPLEHTVEPLKIAKFVKIVYDTTSTTNNTVTLDMAKAYTLTAYYTVAYYIAWNMLLMIILAVIFIILIIALVAVRRKSIEARETEYV